MRLSSFIFDAYGTLFDVHAAVRRHSSRLGPESQRLSEIWRAKQLEYSWVGTLMGEPTDFWALTERSLDYALAKVPTADPSQRDSLLQAYWQLDCYPEVPRVLATLKNAGARLGILSNGRSDMLEAAVRSSALDTLLDDIFSVDAVGKFKTHPEVYEMVSTSWRQYPASVSFQSSNRWDVAGAARYGFRSVWINRTNEPDEYPDHPPQVILPSLKGLVDVS